MIRYSNLQATVGITEVKTFNVFQTDAAYIHSSKSTNFKLFIQRRISFVIMLLLYLNQRN